MDKNKSQDPESSVIPTIVGDLSPVAQDLTEIVFDKVLNEGLLQEIPLVKSVVGLAKAGRSIRDSLYLKKVLAFLGPLSQASIEERKRFVAKLLDKKNKLEEFSEAVVSLTERADSRNKTKLYGMFFLAHIQLTYEYEDTLKLCSMIERAFWSDLVRLPEYINGEAESNLLTSELYKNGFLDLTGFDGGQFGESKSGGAIYTINWFGKQVAEMLQELNDEEA